MNISAGRLNVIDRALTELDSRLGLPFWELKELLMRKTPSVSEALVDEGLSAAVQLRLIDSDHDFVTLSSSGKSLVSAREADPVLNQRRILSKIITKARRDLLWVAFVGQSELGALPKNEYECFEQLGLIDYRLSESASQWWDGIRKAGALFDAQVLKTIGDEAEQNSIQFEKKRLADKILPANGIQWVSRENDLLGFDILSFVGNGLSPFERLRIEVKKLSTGIGSELYFFLSRNEAEISASSPSYVFHLWEFQSGGQHTLHVAPKEIILAKLPRDNGTLGLWDSAKIFIEACDYSEFESFPVRSDL